MDTLVFYSKIDWWIGGLLVLMAIMFLLFPLWEWKYNTERSIHSKILIGILIWPWALLPLWLLLSIEYRVTERQLVVESGLGETEINIEDITDITPTHNTLSAPALSLDRLEVVYADKSIIISPKHKQAFLEAIEQRKQQLDK
ncbi:PH domain-containing protein [Psychrobacter sp. FDAARGOS_221]|uniref:PH domain-containing protein n=1 Tax=Psychrobacter sp. FDAARGOS_221 TaxID=1975705 RepID=UPI000BB59FAC|nr:PH domain-containing protein [Psychrobacter sp. FDAARGOS_221]PNK60841.1 hypothetical protein A6J60_008085 [Psychrobacter sp. FDAARGOS_221]